jgi:hypothetical protein
VCNALAVSVRSERQETELHDRAHRDTLRGSLEFFCPEYMVACCYPSPYRPVEHFVPPFPTCYDRARPVTVAGAWLCQCQTMVMQFVWCRLGLTFLTFILKVSGIFDVTSAPLLLHGTVNWWAPNLYYLIVINISMAVAFYGLLCIYHGLENELRWCEPWPKFLCIKGVVFFTFWQSLAIEAFVYIAGDIHGHDGPQIQNLLICLEMLVASILFYFNFPAEEWMDGRVNVLRVPDPQAPNHTLCEILTGYRDFCDEARKCVRSVVIDLGDHGEVPAEQAMVGRGFAHPQPDAAGPGEEVGLIAAQHNLPGRGKWRCLYTLTTLQIVSFCYVQPTTER